LSVCGHGFRIPLPFARFPSPASRPHTARILAIPSKRLLLMALPNKTKIPVGNPSSRAKYRINPRKKSARGRHGSPCTRRKGKKKTSILASAVAIKVLGARAGRRRGGSWVERFPPRGPARPAAIRRPVHLRRVRLGQAGGRGALSSWWLELLEGDSLYERMTKIRLIPVDTTLSIINPDVVAASPRAPRRRRSFNRDISQAREHLSDQGRGGEAPRQDPRFRGFAKFLRADGRIAAASAPHARGALCSERPAYMRPGAGCAGQGAVDLRADLWALGLHCVRVLHGADGCCGRPSRGVAMDVRPDRQRSAAAARAVPTRPAGVVHRRGSIRPSIATSKKRFQTAKDVRGGARHGAPRPGRGSFAQMRPRGAFMNEPTPAPGTNNPFLSGGSSAFSERGERPAPDADAVRGRKQANFVSGGFGPWGKTPPSQPGGARRPSPNASTLSFRRARAGPRFPRPPPRTSTGKGRVGKIALGRGVARASSAAGA